MPIKLETCFNYTLQELPEAAQWLIKQLGSHKLICLSGSMGAGKTTLIRELCKQLGTRGEINSPSFSLVNEYPCGEDSLIYHFDFYRINSIEEVYDIGYETYFDSGHLCLIEWPEKIEELLEDEPALYFSISGMGDARKICLDSNP